MVMTGGYANAETPSKKIRDGASDLIETIQDGASDLVENLLDLVVEDRPCLETALLGPTVGPYGELEDSPRFKAATKNTIRAAIKALIFSACFAASGCILINKWDPLFAMIPIAIVCIQIIWMMENNQNTALVKAYYRSELLEYRVRKRVADVKNIICDLSYHLRLIEEKSLADAKQGRGTDREPSVATTQASHDTPKAGGFELETAIAERGQELPKADKDQMESWRESKVRTGSRILLKSLPLVASALACTIIFRQSYNTLYALIPLVIACFQLFLMREISKRSLHDKIGRINSGACTEFNKRIYHLENDARQAGVTAISIGVMVAEIPLPPPSLFTNEIRMQECRRDRDTTRDAMKALVVENL